MSENQITLTTRAQTIVRADVTRAVKSGVAYAEYVAEMSVTEDTIPAHVAIFRDAYRAHTAKTLEAATIAHDVDATEETRAALEAATIMAAGPAVKAYATKIRMGLRHWVTKSEETEETEPETGEETEAETETEETGEPDYLATIANAVTVALSAGVTRDEIADVVAGLLHVAAAA